MNVRAILATMVVIGYVGFEVNALRRSQHLFEPLFTFDQFTSMQRASERCGAAEPGVKEAFEQNYAAVQVRAVRDVAEGRPEGSAEDAAQELAERARARRAEVDELVDSGGCDHPEVRTLRMLYEQRARLRIRVR